ncbi:integrating conjugative element protein [Entomomonas sp. E2T0]|uniref:integrating conjugative element protein n=1 Tax=Entomomonas sp. E2T0 TaxID=2930213 RepID=UPI00222848FD|nr:integrating conjugative element protein [Entomomonas sp. E2T0]UYZ83091.1 integrating conjugative element protein [Entomomonas sp. E2T0]
MANPDKQLTVVVDRSNSSALKYYQSLNVQDNSKPIKKIPALNIKPVNEAAMLPIISDKLSPGKVEPRVINANGLIRPFFMIGDDDLSVAWLKERVVALEKLQAVGLVVNVKTNSSLNQLKKLAPNLMILPVSGDDIADRLALSHYPVLITATAIEQ